MSRVLQSLRPLLFLPTALWLGACQTDPKDQALADQVLAHINREPALHSNQIRVQVIDEVVYLYGIVDTQRELFAVETAARSTPGVTHLVNATTVDNPPF